MIKRSRINWFRLNRDLHRDIGFLCIGLTIVFAVSGIAVNHIRDWNSNYIVTSYKQKITITPLDDEQLLNQKLVENFSVTDTVKASYWASPKVYKVFFKGGGSLTADFKSQVGVYEKISSRPILKEFNNLHLNKVQKGWVIISDIYAGLLIFLAISSLFMVKGKYSPWRKKRGWLVLVGVILPTVYMYI